MNFTGPELASTYRTHLYTREHLRSPQLNDLMDRIESAIEQTGTDWAEFPTPEQWETIAATLTLVANEPITFAVSGIDG